MIKKILNFFTRNNRMEKIIDDAINERYIYGRKKDIEIKTDVDFDNFNEIKNIIENIECENQKYVDFEDAIKIGTWNVVMSKLYNIKTEELKEDQNIDTILTLGRDTNMIKTDNNIGVSSDTFNFKNINYDYLRMNYNVIDKIINKGIEREDFKNLKREILNEYDTKDNIAICDTGITLTQQYFLSNYLELENPIYVLSNLYDEYKDKKIIDEKAKSYGTIYTNKKGMKIVELNLLDNERVNKEDKESLYLRMESIYHPVAAFEYVNKVERIQKRYSILDYIMAFLYCLSSDTIRKTKDLEKGIEKLNDKLNKF